LEEGLLEEVVRIILVSGKSAVELGLYVLLPVMVVMMALMKVVEAKGGLALVARLLTPILKVFGIPGAGAFAILQLLLVSFAAPVATLSIMERDGTARRSIAATLAMIFTMSQANVVFPMVAVGLDLSIIVLTSLAGGLCAAALTYYLFARSARDHDPSVIGILPPEKPKWASSPLTLMIQGGQEGVQIVLGAIPILVLAICLVNGLKGVGAIALLEAFLSPALGAIGLPAVAVLPIATKFLAGGTAMMGVTLDLLKGGAMTVTEFNRLAGFIINPFDIVGVAVLIAAGSRCASVVRPAVAGATVGVLIRGLLHLLIF
jgi:spore maturation protein SpmB